MASSKRMLVFTLTVLAACLTLGSGVAFGQAVFGNITGTVTDATGAAVPGAQVLITDVDRRLPYQTQTNSSGNYTQTHLIAGHYQVKIAALGFAEFVVTADVEVDATTRVDAQLQLGKTATSVTVTAESPLLKTDRSDVSNTLQADELGKLPILDRNLTSLMFALPGTGKQSSTSGSHGSPENPQSDFRTPVNGELAYSNGFTLDGTENHSNVLGLVVINPNPDALEEFKVTSSNYDAEFGNASGAMLEGITKSGTNQIHGSLFEYVRNDKFNAANPFTNINPAIKWNQFGGSVGGALRKDKVFGFFAYQGTRRRTGGSQAFTVPTTAERSGDLRALLGNFICTDGSTSPTGCTGTHSPFMVTTTQGASVAAQDGMVFDPSTGSPDGTARQAISTGGLVNVLTPAAPMQQLLTFLPMPNTGAPGQIFNNYIASVGEQFDTGQYDGRLDDTISEKMHLFGRYSTAGFNLHAPGAYGEEAGGPSPDVVGFAGHSLARNQSFALGWSYSLSPTLIADFRFGTYRYRVNVNPNGLGRTPASDAGLVGLNRGTSDTSGMPAFTINGNGGFKFGYSLGVNGCNCPLGETENHFQWVSNWTKQTGNHTIKWGADARRAQQRRNDSDGHRSGELTFVPSTTGNLDVDTAAAGNATSGSGLASYLLGQPNYFQEQITGIGFYPAIRQTRLYFYGQDAWRATSKLTVTYGLRYENYLPQTAAKPGGGGTFDPTTGEVVVAGVGSTPANMGIKAYNLGFAPRLGLAYQLQPKTVLRAGYGRSFNAAGVGAVFAQNPELDPPVQPIIALNPANPYSTAIPGFLASGPPPPSQFNPTVGPNGRYPLPNGVQIFFYFDTPDSYRIPLADFWNFSIQHEIQPSLTLDVAYVGNVGRHLFANENRNQAVPGPGNFDPRRPFFPKYGLEQPIFDVCNCDNSSYHSLQAKLQKRMSRGLDLLLTYTWSKAITQSEGGYSFDNNYNLRGDHGPASFDRTHALTLLHTWELPFGRGRRWATTQNKALDAVVSGWRFSGVTTMYSGVAFTPYVSNAPLLNTDFNSVRPDIIGDSHVSSPNAGLWFNPAAYTSPQQPFRDGTASKGSLRGPAEYVFNLALAKEFVIREGKRLEFRWENFNAVNHPNLGLPSSTVDVGGAGQITATATDMRQMQFGLHFRF
jgi:hypothetical protein